MNSLILLSMLFTGGQENTILNNECWGQEKQCGNFTYNRVKILDSVGIERCAGGE